MAGSVTAIREERIEFANSRGEKLVGVLHGPVTQTMVVSCHGMFSSKEGTKHVLLAALLARRGVSLLRFDFAGRGESDGALFNLSYSRRVEDLDAALNALQKRGAKQFAVFGSSMGGSVALLTAARDERIVAVATLAAIGHPAQLLYERDARAVHCMERDGYFDAPEGRIGREFLDDSRAHNVVAAVGILRAPVLVVHGDADEVVPCSDAHDIAAAARHASLELVEGADHQFSQLTHLRPALQRIASFLAEGLQCTA